MKKFYLQSILILGISFQVISQNSKPFEGVITYEFAFEGLPPEAEGMMAGSGMKVFIKNEKSRSESNMGFSQTVVIADAKKETSVSLTDMMGQKFMIKSTPEEIKKEKEKAPKIEYKSDTKEIAGFKCSKAICTVTDKEGKNQSFDVYYSPEIPASTYNTSIRGIKGAPLEFFMNQGPMKIKVTAKTVNRESVPESKFEIPAGYQEMTKEEMMKAYQKMGNH